MLFKKHKMKKDHESFAESVKLIEQKQFYHDISEISKTLKHIDETLCAKKFSDLLGAVLKVDDNKPLPKDTRN